MHQEKIALAVLVLVVTCTPLVAHANDVEQLYDYYSVDAPEEEPFGKYDTITTYQEAQCASVKYSAVRKADPHYEELISRQAELSHKLDELKKALQNAYSLSFTEIVSLESEYRSTEAKLKSIELCLSSADVDIDLNFSEIPSRSEYLNARKELDEYLASKELGTVPFTDVVAVMNKVTEGSNNDWIYTEKGMSVVLLYNGTCVETTDTTAVFDCGNEIQVSYTNMDSICAKVGQAMKQGEPVGRSSDMVGVSLVLSGQHVSIFEPAQIGGQDETEDVQDIRD